MDLLSGLNLGWLARPPCESNTLRSPLPSGLTWWTQSTGARGCFRTTASSHLPFYMIQDRPGLTPGTCAQQRMLQLACSCPLPRQPKNV